MNKRLLTPQEITQRLGVSRHTLYKWPNNRTNLQPRKIGGLLRYTKEDYEQFLNRGVNKGKMEVQNVS